MKTRLIQKLCCLLLLTLAGGTANAQTTTGTVTGRVTDSGGATIPETGVRLENLSTGVALTAQSDPEGNYVFPLVAPGRYRVTVEKSGFQRFAAQFDLNVNQTARVDAVLTVGQVSEAITVREQGVLIESETSSLGQVISSKQVADLPLNGRNPFALAALTPGVTPLGSFGVGLNTTRSAAQMAGANNFMANGGIAGSNEVLLDGVPITVCCQGQPAIIPSVDVTAEFKVQTNSSSAEFGRTSGGILNIMTKSGTNRLSGSAYEFLGNEQLNAANFFTNRSGRAPIPGRSDFRTPLRYNQFGFTVGGPLTIPKLYSGKDKTFFFGGYEGTRVRQYGFVTTTVPAAENRSGDFSSAPFPVYDPATTRADPANAGQFLRSPFAGNQIPASRQSAIGQGYTKLFPLPIRPGVVNNFDFTQAISTNDAQGNVRVDHNINEANRLFARYSISDDSYHLGDWANGITGNAQYIGANTFVLDYVRVISPSMVLNLRYGLARQRNEVVPDALSTSATSVGFPASFEAQQLVREVPLLNVSNYRSLGNDSLRNWSRYTHALAANATWIKRGHTIKFGWDGRLFRDNQLSLDGGAGTFSYDTAYTTGPNPRAGVPAGQGPYDSYAALLLGVASSGSIRYSDTWARQQYYHALFFQDDWRLTSKLTLNLGLRWDIETGFTERFNRQAYLDPNVPSPLAQATGLPLRGGAVFSGVNGAPRQLWKTDANNFAPRVGLAYSITPKTVVRGAYGIFFLPTSQRGYGSTNPGFQVSTNYVASIDGVTPVGTVANPFPNGTIPLTGAALGAATLAGSGIAGLVYDTPMSYTQQWNFGIQRELPWAFLLNVAYAGNHSVKLPLNFNSNALPLQYYGAKGDQSQVAYLTQLVPNPFAGVITAGTLAASTVQRQTLLRAYPQFTSINLQYLGQAGAVYDALQVTLQRRLSHGLSMLLAYTWSKNIGDANNLTTGFLDVGTPGYQNDFNRRLERSVVATDIPHRLVLSSNYELPFGKGKAFGGGMKPWMNAVVGGWQVNGILTVQSGFPLQFSNSGAPAFAGSRPSFTGTDATVTTSGSIESRLGGVSGGTGYFNAAGFRVPQSFEFGDVPRLTDRIRGPGGRNVDFSLMKFFPITERVRLQFRAEAFNALNHPVFGNPNTGVNGASFGIISSQANAPRNLQLALKLLW